MSQSGPRQAATLKWSHKSNAGLQGTMQSRGMPGNFTLFWGDGTNDHIKPQPGKPTVTGHTFKKPGVYTAWAAIDGDPDPYLSVTYRVLATPYPNVTVEAATDRDYTARVVFGDDGDDTGPIGRYTITFGVGGTVVPYVPGIPGTSVEQYMPAGAQKIHVQDHWSGLARTYDLTIAEPVIDPALTVSEDTSDPDRRTVLLTVTAATGTDRTVTIDWADGTDPDTIEATAGASATHAYDFAGDYIVAAAYSDDPGTVQYVPVTVPFTGTEGGK